VLLEVIGQHIDARREERNLYFGRTRVAICALVLGDDARFVCGSDGHE
jgi:hypothetical protein